MEKGYVCCENEIVIESDIAPWGLPYEEIPLHIKLKKEILFDTIIVHLPDNLDLVEPINIGDYKINQRDIIIHSIKRANLFSDVFFGLVVKYVNIPELLKVEKKIVFEIIKDNSIIHTFDMKCRIFRPQLKLKKVPNIIELSNNFNLKDILLELQYTGFGDIKIGIEARIGGNLVSQGESLIYELLLRLSEKGLISNETEKISGDTNGGLSIDPTYVSEVVEKVQKTIREGNIPLEILDNETIESLKKYFLELKNREDSSEIIFGEINTLLLSILKDILERNPEENIELKDAKTRIKTKINAPIDNIQLKINYTDILKNTYKPIEVTIEVDDKLTTYKNAIIEMLIKIEKIDNKPFLNVKEISMED